MTMTIPAPGQVRHMLGGQIQIRVEVDTGGGEGLGALWDTGRWDQNRWGSVDPVWVDLTAYVVAVAIHQGAERWGERYETGTASVTVDNTTGIFTPESGVPDPWFREFRPGRRMRIVAIPDPETGVKVPLFTGRFEGLEGHPDDAGYAITATLSLHDYAGDWAAFDPLETTDTGNQRTDLRVHAALDRYGWPTDERDIQVGDHNVTGSTLSDTTLEECQRAADAEGGAFYCSKDGLATVQEQGLADDGHPVHRRYKAMSAIRKYRTERKPLMLPVLLIRGNWPGSSTMLHMPGKEVLLRNQKMSNPKPPTGYGLRNGPICTTLLMGKYSPSQYVLSTR